LEAAGAVRQDDGTRACRSYRVGGVRDSREATGVEKHASRLTNVGGVGLRPAPGGPAAPRFEPPRLSEGAVVDETCEGAMPQPEEAIASKDPPRLLGTTSRARCRENDVRAARQVERTAVFANRETIGDELNAFHGLHELHGPASHGARFPPVGFPRNAACRASGVCRFFG
jgi:hypothetical protein